MIISFTIQGGITWILVYVLLFFWWVPLALCMDRWRSKEGEMEE
jgi:hypothetical protein